MAKRGSVFCLLKCCVVVFVSFALSAFNGLALADDTTPDEVVRVPPGVVVSFEGGVVGDNVANVLQKLLEHPDGLPTETYTVQPNDTACGILDARSYPPPCTHMLKLLDRLNQARPPSKSSLKPGDALVLPRLTITRYTTTKKFSGGSPSEVSKQKTIQQYWKSLEPSQVQTTPNTSMIEYKAYELYIPTSGDKASLQLIARLAPVRSTNVLVDMLRVTPPAAKLHAARTANEYKNACETGTAVTDALAYQDYSDPDKDALVVIGNNLPQQTVPVHLIDTPLLPSPNLYPAFGDMPGAQPWKCKWNNEFSPVHHHATHLAGILASQGNGFGFVGLCPKVKVKPFEWIKPGPNGKPLAASADRAIQLAQRISMSERAGQPLRVYLAAVSFDPPTVRLSAGHFQNPDQRFLRRLEKTIKDARPLLIVAAGQAESSADLAVNLSPTSAESPQNLGDLENVIVVTACTECSQSQTTLMSTAWYSSGDRRIVHVAAPGGSGIPGWITNDSIGVAYGTSQAAAYTAGVAASMIGAFPTIYTEPKMVKVRLQVTSRPIVRRMDGTPNPDADKIAAGVVDPVLARLDPSQHWLKDGGTWRTVKIKGFSAERMVLRDTDGYERGANMSTVLRILQTPDTISKRQWTIYTDRALAGDGGVGEVGRIGPVTPAGPMTIAFCDGSSKPLDKIEDLIIAISGAQNDECATS
jgi:subtilisin family serine protease